jgi:bleomycin hydrolase
MKNFLFRGLAFGLCVALFLSLPLSAQEATVTQTKADNPSKTEGYEFTIDRQLFCSPVKSQDNTGTCWSYATVSFLESELARTGQGEHDLSEMFIVRNVYLDKAQNYLLRQGKANFSQGALTHDYLRAAQRHGLMPESAYSGLMDGITRHNHSELEAVATGLLEVFVKQKSLSKKWRPLMENVLDAYLGKPPAEFSYQGKDHTPQTFAQTLKYNADEYLNITSFNHHPFGKSFVLEIPDNFSNGSFLNVPLDNLVTTIDNALDAGFTVAWDGDVSERGFLRNEGIAVLPTGENKDFAKSPGREEIYDQNKRQEAFESLATSDDHLMHLVGRAFDQNGTKYYIIKNSWGEIGQHKGYLYMSEAYLRAKTVAITVHQDALKSATE